MRTIIFVIASSLLAAGSAAPAKYDRMAVPDAIETGKPVSCIHIQDVRETRVHGDQVIDFITSGRKAYRNKLPYSCPSLGFEEKFLHETSINQYCSVDIITVLQSSGGGLDRGASCGLGKFQPIELVKR